MRRSLQLDRLGRTGTAGPLATAGCSLSLVAIGRQILQTGRNILSQRYNSAGAKERRENVSGREASETAKTADQARV
jgi:hypothetical protein